MVSGACLRAQTQSRRFLVSSPFNQMTFRGSTWLSVLLPLAAAALVLGGGGCGGSDGSQTEAATVTKAQFIRRADATCAKAEKRQLALVQKFGERETQQSEDAELELVRFAGVPPLAVEAEELAVLPLPSADARQAEAFLEAFEQGVEQAEQNPGALLNSTQNPFEKSEELAARFGFKVCAGA
jgi:hypothetical protein